MLKNLYKIDVYEGDKKEADDKQTNLVLLVDTRTEDTYKILVSKLIKAKPGLVITFRQKDSNTQVINLRTDSEIIRNLIDNNQSHLMVRDVAAGALEAFLSGQVTFNEARKAHEVLD